MKNFPKQETGLYRTVLFIAELRNSSCQHYISSNSVIGLPSTGALFCKQKEMNFKAKHKNPLQVLRLN